MVFQKHGRVMDGVTSIPKRVLKGRLFIESKRLNPPFHLLLDEKRKEVWYLKIIFKQHINLNLGISVNLFIISPLTWDHGIFQIVTKQRIQRSMDETLRPNLGACGNQESSPRIEWAIVVASHFLSVTFSGRSFLDMDASKNRGTPKWINGKPY